MGLRGGIDITSQKQFSVSTGKLHMPCPHQDQSGIYIHVVIKNGVCYRSDVCMVIECKYHGRHNDIETIISITW